MLLIDTNVLVHAVNHDADEHERCRALIESCRRSATPWHATWPILYEFLRVVTHPIMPRPLKVAQAWSVIEGILASPGFAVLLPTSRHAEVAADTFASMPWLRANVLHDAHTAIVMREHGIRAIYTLDQAFRQFNFLHVLDPLSETL